MLKFKKIQVDRCGYKEDQYVLQSSDVDSKIVTRDGSGMFRCYIDSDTESMYLEYDLKTGGGKGLKFAKDEVLRCVGYICPDAKPGKRSE